MLDDSYNANPDSVRAALETLAGLECAGRRVAVLGRMAELGEAAGAEHFAIGEFAAGRADVVISVGGLDAPGIAKGAGAAGGEVLHFDDAGDAGAHIRDHAAGDDLILVKGSRSSRMEAVIEGMERISEGV